MNVILTHEQADFDALAALLGAALLHDRSLPVLPRRLNRNVRNFLNLYSSEFSFVDARDLPALPIESVTLVDTQSMVTLKGIHAKTKIKVIDHHPQRPDLNPEWTVHVDRVGSCTTLLVEELRDHNGNLTVLQATLLLLGIYEDTGSLTYVSTTSRDVRAAAYLLEQGASLQIAADYLNPPLSAEQRRIYDQLLAAVTAYRIQGQNILVATAVATGMNEEISSVAHKIRDLLDPDGLFLLVQTDEGIRIVARSTTDSVDVGAIASEFGGGGHARAASALLRVESTPDGKSPTLEEVSTHLVERLKQLVRPSVTAGRIMSRHPLVLSPDTSAQDAAALMQRYGYEGYPVVRDGKVIGLLTRRAVDRALAHKLNLAAVSLMDAGEVSVVPSDPLEHLQRLMASTGWGQIPVVSPEDGSVIGIVTRTDLLKVMGRQQQAIPGRINLKDRLEQALPPARTAFLKLLASQAHELHLPVYVVGGFVRDLLLERPSLDFDVVVEGDASLLGKALHRKYGGRLVVHSRFGTAKWQLGDAVKTILAEMHLPVENEGEIPVALDIISARTEFYDHPTALPTVERSSIKHDLHRRDFTINTLALRLDGRHYGELYDYFGGMGDMDRKLVRVLHSLSFVDDPTRMLRAIRFEQRFGFRVEDRTLELMDEARPLLRQISGDRLRHELDLVLSEARAVDILQRLDELELLSSICADLRWDPSKEEFLEFAWQHTSDEPWHLPGVVSSIPVRRILGYLIWLSDLPGDVQERIAARLRFARPLCTMLEDLNNLSSHLDDLMDSSISQAAGILDGYSMVSIYAAWCFHREDTVGEILKKYAGEWRHVRTCSDGRDLMQLGITPGPAYREILGELRAAWLDGRVRSKEEEKELLVRLVEAWKGRE